MGQRPSIAITTHGKCNPRADAGPFPGCYREPVRRSDKFHIVGKPTRLMVQLVLFCPPGAATSRQAVGVEREEANCEITARRLDEAIDAGPNALASS